jgi:hypothetical protein
MEAMFVIWIETNGREFDHAFKVYANRCTKTLPVDSSLELKDASADLGTIFIILPICRHRNDVKHMT